MNMDKNILWFKEINKNMISEVGGKGANLGEMINSNFPIPDGFVVTANAYAKEMKENKVLEKIEEIERNIDVNNTKELNEGSKKVKEVIMKTKMSKELEDEIRDSYNKIGKTNFVAVRSSATAEDLPSASFAGQQNSYLNVQGSKELIETIKGCWASLFNSRAIFYRRKQNFSIEKVKIAVVVQKMVNSEKSGIMFTANPITSNREEIVIEGGYGLGEAIVSGSITPDTYIVNKNNWKITNKSISTQLWKYSRAKQGNKKEDIEINQQSIQKINDKDIIELAKIGYNIEKHYNNPQDLEWAIENNKLYIVQSRPITTLNEEKGQEESIDEKITPILKGLGASSGFVTGPVKIIFDMTELEKVNEGDILVTGMTTPDMVPAMRRAKGIITDEGGITSHAAIVSRELGIPAVVGTTNATKVLKDEQIVTVDAHKGNIYAGEIMHKENIQKEKEPEKIDFLTATKVKVNVAMPEAAERAAQTEADGIGLLRAEHMFTSTGKHPIYFIDNKQYDQLKDLIKEQMKKVLVHFKEKPVYYRTFDARTDEFRQLEGGKNEPHEDNPMLGWHGIRRSIDQQELIKAEFKAIKELKEEGFNNIGVMIPFTQHVDEYKEAKKIAEGIGLIPHKDCFFGVMVETPGCSLTIEDYINAKLDFVSFGTNDLTQLTLGLDRNNGRIQKWFNELHPSILKQIAYVIDKCKDANVRTSICGQAGSDPKMVEYLIGLGIDSISANIDAVREIKKVVYYAERNLILEQIRERKRAKKELSF
jgi:pyruvate, water dikinase